MSLGSAHPTWYERATPDEIKEITEIDRSIAERRRRRQILVNRTEMRTQVWVEHHRPNTDNLTLPTLLSVCSDVAARRGVFRGVGMGVSRGRRRFQRLWARLL
jgi:hypothetical protein